MRVPLDLLASLALGIFAAVVLIAHRVAGAPDGFERVARQGSTPFLQLGMMHAGYWLLQPVVKSCARARMAPAFLSWLSLLPAAIAGVAAARGHWGFVAWSLLVSALLDVLDGAVARATGQSSVAGAVLDSVLDRYAETFFFAGALAFYDHHLAAQMIVLAALIGSFLVTYSTAKAEAVRVTPPRGWMKRSDRLSALIIGSGLTPIVQHWTTAAGTSLVSPILITLAIIAVLANVSAVMRFAALGRVAQS
jgi:CDP-diacylglycerol---glycerol-3-phosphate 3-phosphatidyltransferase